MRLQTPRAWDKVPSGMMVDGDAVGPGSCAIIRTIINDGANFGILPKKILKN